MGGEQGQERQLPSRLFGGVRREAAEEAIAAAQQHAAELATEVERLRARVSEQEAELGGLREQEAAVTAALIDAQASAERLRARAERLAQARLREAQETVLGLRQYAHDIVLELLRHVKDATETLDRLSKAADELPVDQRVASPWTAEPDAAAPETGRAEAAPTRIPPAETAPPEAAPPEPAPPEPAPAEVAPPAPVEAGPAEPAPPEAEPPEAHEPGEAQPAAWFRDEGASEPAPVTAAPLPIAPRGGQLEVHVEPIRSADRAIAFERRLLELDGVRNVRLHTFADGAATFTIEINGDGPDLLPLMEERVQILAVSGDRIELRLPSEE